MTIPSNQIGNKYPLDNEIPNALIGYDATNHTMQCIPGITVTNGLITNTNSPSFLAYWASNATNVTGDGTVYTLTTTTKVYDNKNNWNGSIFTAPNYDDNYKFDVCLRLSGFLALTTNLILYAQTTSQMCYICNLNITSLILSGGYLAIGSTPVMRVLANQTVQFKLQVSGTIGLGKVISVIGGALTSGPSQISGYRV